MICAEPAAAVTLENLLYYLQDQISEQWYQFGIVLGVPNTTLEHLLQSYNQKECLVELLDYWLKHHPDQPQWQEVIEAINKVTDRIPQ